MAEVTSGSCETSKYSGDKYTCGLKLSWSISSQSVANNTSTISWSLATTGTISSTYWFACRNLVVKLNGTTVYSPGNFDLYGGTVKSGTITVTHDAAGTKTMTGSISCQIYTSDTRTASGSWSLKSIPRASTPTLSVSSVNVSGSVTITTNRASSSFTHTLTWSCGSSSGTIATGVGASYAWTVPVAVGNAISGAALKTVTITCVTYNGSTNIGSKTVTITVKIPASTITLNKTSVDIGSVISLSLTSYSSHCMHTITYTLGTKSWTGSTGAWTVPVSALSEISGQSATAKVTVTTKNGSATIGSNSKTFTITVPKGSFSASPTSSITLGSTNVTFTASILSGLKYTLTYSGAGTGTIVSNTTNATTNWTPPLSLANYITTSTSATLTITMTTYNAMTSLGSTTLTITVTVPSNSSTLPTISSVTFNNTFTNYGADIYVATLSAVRVTAISASAKLGATIKSYSTTFNGSTYSGTSFTTSKPGSSGTFSMVTTVTDSRGRTASVTNSFIFVAYASPSATLSCSRCNQDGTLSDIGDYGKLSFSGVVTAIENYTISGTLKYKRRIDTAYTSLSLTVSANTITFNGVVPMDSSYSFDIVATVTDLAGKTVTKTMTLSTGIVPVDYLAGGTGISFGKSAERSGLESNWELYFTSGKGLWLKDRTDTDYAGVRDNGSNLWIGSSSSTSHHHVGATYISSGHDGTSGNESVYIAVPNDDNNESSNYLALHAKNAGDYVRSVKTFKKLESGTDLNTVTDAGSYYAGNNNEAATMTNQPDESKHVAHTFTLIVEWVLNGNVGSSSHNYIRQTWQTYDDADEFFVRSSTNGGSSWSDWKRYSSRMISGYSEGNRLTSANLSAMTNGAEAIFHFLATSSMTTGKPPSDAHILQLNWDNTGGYDSQLALPASGNSIYWRSRASTGSTWNGLTYGSWTPNFANNSITLSAGTRAGWYLKIGNVVLLGFSLKNGSLKNSATSAQNIKITGLPFTPSTNVKHYGGGGHAQGTNLSTYAANYAFSGYIIDSDDVALYGRTLTVAQTKNLTDYLKVPASTTATAVYLSGTICYMATTNY